MASTTPVAKLYRECIKCPESQAVLLRMPLHVSNIGVRATSEFDPKIGLPRITLAF